MTATHIVPRGGGTGKEVPANIIQAGEEPWNKWYQASHDTSRITITMKQRIKVNAIGFKSANDCPHRDPDTVEIKYLAPNYSNAVLAKHSLDFGGARWHTVVFGGIDLDSKQFIFEFHNTKCKEIQLGEIVFYHHA